MTLIKAFKAFIVQVFAVKTERQTRNRRGQKSIYKRRASRNKKQKMGSEAECLQLAAFSFTPAVLR